MKNVCVFLSSKNVGIDVSEELSLLAEFFSSKGYGLVYGGGNRGNMGVVSREFSDKEAKISGYSLQMFHKKGFTPDYIDHLEIADTFSDRKQRMIDNSDIFIIFPGGLGTIDELIDVINLDGLEILGKGIYLLNKDGFWKELLTWMNKALEMEYIPLAPPNLHVSESFEEMLQQITRNEQL